MAQSTVVGQENGRVSKRGQSGKAKKGGATFVARYTEPGADPLRNVVWVLQARDASAARHLPAEFALR